jgi:hypothetical protein
VFAAGDLSDDRPSVASIAAATSLFMGRAAVVTRR